MEKKNLLFLALIPLLASCAAAGTSTNSEDASSNDKVSSSEQSETSQSQEESSKIDSSSNREDGFVEKEMTDQAFTDRILGLMGSDDERCYRVTDNLKSKLDVTDENLKRIYTARTDEVDVTYQDLDACLFSYKGHCTTDDGDDFDFSFTHSYFRNEAKDNIRGFQEFNVTSTNPRYQEFLKNGKYYFDVPRPADYNPDKVETVDQLCWALLDDNDMFGYGISYKTAEILNTTMDDTMRYYQKDNEELFECNYVVEDDEDRATIDCQMYLTDGLMSKGKVHNTLKDKIHGIEDVYDDDFVFEIDPKDKLVEPSTDGYLKAELGETEGIWFYENLIYYIY